ncbi:unnamed protein product, partial [Mesorhabditis spiculigera]
MGDTPNDSGDPLTDHEQESDTTATNLDGDLQRLLATFLSGNSDGNGGVVEGLVEEKPLTPTGPSPIIMKTRKEPAFDRSFGKSHMDCLKCNATIAVGTNPYNTLVHINAHVQTASFRCSFRAMKAAKYHVKASHGGVGEVDDLQTPELIQEIGKVAMECFPELEHLFKKWVTTRMKRLGFWPEYRKLCGVRDNEKLGDDSDDLQLVLDAPTGSKLAPLTVDDDDDDQFPTLMQSSHTGGPPWLHESQVYEARRKERDSGPAARLNCEMCNKPYSVLGNPYNTFRHIEFTHMDRKAFGCSLCSFQNPEKLRIESHLRQEHYDAGTVVDQQNPEFCEELTSIAKRCFPSLSDYFDTAKQNRISKYMKSLRANQPNNTSLQHDLSFNPSALFENSHKNSPSFSRNIKTEGYFCEMCHDITDLGDDDEAVISMAVLHASAHSSFQRYSCDTCTFTATDPRPFEKHLSSFHKGEGKMEDRMNPKMFAEHCDLAKTCFPEFILQLDDFSGVYPYEDQQSAARDVKRRKLSDADMSEAGGSGTSSFALKFQAKIEPTTEPVQVLSPGAMPPMTVCKKCNVHLDLTRSKVAALYRHALSRHITVSTYKCSECPYMGTHMSDMDLHLQKAHDGAASAMPEITEEFVRIAQEETHHCFPRFGNLIAECATRKWLSRALVGDDEDGRVHTETCRICSNVIRPSVNQRGSITEQAFLNHVRTHLDRKQFCCSVCGMEIALRTNCSKHVSTQHTGMGALIVDRMDAQLLATVTQTAKKCFPGHDDIFDAYKRRTELTMRSSSASQRNQDTGPENPNLIRSKLPDQIVLLGGRKRRTESNEELFSTPIRGSPSVPTPMDPHPNQLLLDKIKQQIEANQQSSSMDETERVRIRLRNQELEIRGLQQQLQEVRTASIAQPNNLAKELKEAKAEIERLKNQKANLYAMIGKNHEEIETARVENEKLRKMLSELGGEV